MAQASSSESTINDALGEALRNALAREPSIHGNKKSKVVFTAYGEEVHPL